MEVQRTPLEVNHAAFVMWVAHQAVVVMETRALDTGTAKDVTGVLRITRGPATNTNAETEMGKFMEKEVLYYVGGDGGVRVFERGT